VKDYLKIYYDWIKKIIVVWRKLDSVHKVHLKLTKNNWIRINKIINNSNRNYEICLGSHWCEPDGHSVCMGVIPRPDFNSEEHAKWLEKFKKDVFAK